MFNIYKPEVFQGNLKKKNYFEGWYYKHVSADLRHTFSFIPGISLTEGDSHVFIQVINGSTGYSTYIKYALDEFSWKKIKVEAVENEASFKVAGQHSSRQEGRRRGQSVPSFLWDRNRRNKK